MTVLDQDDVLDPVPLAVDRDPVLRAETLHQVHALGDFRGERRNRMIGDHEDPSGVEDLHRFPVRPECVAEEAGEVIDGRRPDDVIEEQLGDRQPLDLLAGRHRTAEPPRDDLLDHGLAHTRSRR